VAGGFACPEALMVGNRRPSQCTPLFPFFLIGGSISFQCSTRTPNISSPYQNYQDFQTYSQNMGHEDPGTTYKYYSKLSNDDVRDVILKKSKTSN